METTIPNPHRSLRKPAKPRGRFYNPAKLLFFNYKCHMNAHRIAAPLSSDYSKLPELGIFARQNEDAILKSFKALARGDKYCFKYGNDSQRLGDMRRRALWEPMPEGMRAKYGGDFGNFHKILLAASIDLDNARTMGFLNRHKSIRAPFRFATKTMFRKLVFGYMLLTLAVNIDEFISPSKTPTTTLEYMQEQRKAEEQWRKEHGYTEDFHFYIPVRERETYEEYRDRLNSLTPFQIQAVTDSAFQAFVKEKNSRQQEE